MSGPGDFEITRRDLLKVGAVSVAVSAAPLVAKGQAPVADAPVLSKVSFNVNGKAHSLKLDTRTSLLDALREQLHLTGTKKGCDHGQCGACTVIVDGRRVEAAESEMPKGAKPVAAGLLEGAKPTDENAFKLQLVERTLGAVLAQAKGA